MGGVGAAGCGHSALCVLYVLWSHVEFCLRRWTFGSDLWLVSEICFCYLFVVVWPSVWPIFAKLYQLMMSLLSFVIIAHRCHCLSLPPYHCIISSTSSHGFVFMDCLYAYPLRPLLNFSSGISMLCCNFVTPVR